MGCTAGKQCSRMRELANSDGSNRSRGCLLLGGQGVSVLMCFRSVNGVLG